MNGQSDNATVPSRTTVRIPTASGDELEAWLYLPEGEGPHPAVVMAHGIGAIKAGGLAPFGERFCREGFAESYSTTANGEALPASPARSFPSLVNSRTTAPSSAGQPRTQH
jgi:fermentation-respiration switch protein FrsA (DUF1100 family)